MRGIKKIGTFFVVEGGSDHFSTEEFMGKLRM
jgi:hypothetical protein